MVDFMICVSILMLLGSITFCLCICVPLGIFMYLEHIKNEDDNVT